ncbi:hypothetical protein HUG10_09205 [Halorarum halophilum]|uniref:Uncharacterized protein n=1 Tax=Halorarum halophilum TaxID=2743090 RepID=A0A7D5KX54_9EURY|nr:hypothetical protein [Halobaculum halophilum]QLG27718.1 hypothetical protein HUG10_09205 [Halobaculum halophilum]
MPKRQGDADVQPMSATERRKAEGLATAPGGLAAFVDVEADQAEEGDGE